MWLTPSSFRRTARALLAATAGILLLMTASTTASATATQPLFVQAEVRQLKAHAVLVTIATTPRKPQAAYVNGQRLTIECLRGEGGPFVSYSPIDPVGWDSWVILKGRLPNGQHRWIGISAEDGGGVLVMAVRTRAGSGPCGFDVVKSNDWLLSVGTMIAS